MDEATTEISRSLAPLRDVVSSLARAADGVIPTGRDRARVVRRVQSAGVAAVPALVRSLGSPIESEADWACYLLQRLGCRRVLGKLSALLQDTQVEDDVKARALGLLADLKVPPPKQVVLRDPDAMLENSVRDLVGSLGSRSERSQAVDLILEQVPRDEIASFVGEVLEYGGNRALPLLDALIADPRTPHKTVQELCDLRGSQPRCRSAKDTQILERALNLLEAGKPQRARKWLELLVAAHPDDAEMRSALGVCLLELNLPDAALLHLSRSAEMEPDSALHRWNMAAAARAADRMGICYQVLHDYMKVRDEEVGSLERQREARAFCQAYERMLRDAYPGVPLDRVLQGEELFARAYADLSASRYDEAMARFHEVLKLVPRHYPSWGNLGAAYLALDRTEEAMHCLHRALELNPNYSIARENLALIDQR